MKNALFISALFFSLLSFAQVKQADTYKMVKYDSTYGITMYEKLNFYLGGDSVRYDKKGYSASGWYEDYYEGGQVLHKGYYVEGHLKVYKNFYEHGQLEREFKSEFNKATLSTFFGNGKPHAQIEYLAGNVIKETDYFENGQIEFTEEYDKDGVYIKREFYYENGKPQSILALVDAKKKLFSSKEYFVNGNIKEEGQVHYSKAIGDFQKEGKWLIYNEQGKVVAEQFFSKGEMSNENKF